MSSQAESEVAQIIELYSTVFTVNCCGCSVLALLAYDYLLTLDQEIKQFWKRKITAASALFFIIRYWTLINYDLVGASTWAHMSDKINAAIADGSSAPLTIQSCALLIKAQAGITIFQYMPWAAFSALRVLALSGMRWSLAVIVFVLGSGPAVVNFTEYRYGITGANVLTTGCQGEDNLTPRLGDIRTFLGVSYKSHRVGYPRKSSLGDVLLYNGLKYFAVLLTLNILQVVLTHLSLGTVSQQASYITTFSEPLTAIFISRFLIDLQAANQSSAELGTHTLGSLSLHAAGTDADAGAGTLRFASRVIGPLGASTRLDGSAASGSVLSDDDYWEGGDNFAAPEGARDDVTEAHASRT
ncbi:hypothetical protein C8Q79DRAFT_1013952 [Trametes meyenii]|nr:hypothetical protein C8Q79DRAFT_1013952 [Trametes meyenii]